MLPNVFEPVMVKAPAPPWLSVQLNVEPPPTNPLADAEVMEIVPMPVPAVVVNPVGAALLNIFVAAPVHTILPPLNVIFFVPVEIVTLIDTVQVFPFKSIVPFEGTKFVQVKALPNVHAPPTPLKLTALKLIPLVVIVLPVVVALKVTVPLPDSRKFVA
jgi:hypothetical protein